MFISLTHICSLLPWLEMSDIIREGEHGREKRKKRCEILRDVLIAVPEYTSKT